MAAIFAIPNEAFLLKDGLVLTFVVPAGPRGCNLSCGFCAIRQRAEVSTREAALTALNFAHFVHDVGAHHRVAAVSIQGYEPTLPESFPYTRAILEAGRAIGAVTGLVTNGVLLAERAAELAELTLTGITVSLDSAEAGVHDRLRGMQGAFDAAVRGISVYVGASGRSGHVAVSSVLRPGHVGDVKGLPAVLDRLSVRRWIVNPLLRIRAHGPVGPVGAERHVVDDLLCLQDEARKYGVEMRLDDELRRLPAALVNYSGLLVHHLERPDGLLRMSPSGACSVGKDVLRPVNSQTPVWCPDECQPHEFVRTILPTDVLSRSVERAA